MTFLQRRDSYLKRKYGITVQDFAHLMIEQGGACFICGSFPKNRSLHVDHQHVPKFKKLDPQLKRHCIRGLLCFQCNKLLMGRGMTFEKAKRIVEYLDRFMSGKVWT